jgi:hypothetical protein
MRHGRWKSASVMRGYVEEGSIWSDNAAARLGLSVTKENPLQNTRAVCSYNECAAELAKRLDCVLT